MLKGDHRRRVAHAPMLAGDRFLRCGGSAGKPGRNNAGNQKADRQYHGGWHRNGRDDRGRGYCQHRCDGYRHQSTHQHVGQFVDVRADACCQVPAVQPDGGRRRSVGQPVIDKGAGLAGGPQRGVVVASRSQ